MKKYNLSKIMKRAWELVKKTGMTISSGLKKAWLEAKNPMKKTIKLNVIGRETFTVNTVTGEITGKTYNARKFIKDNFNAKWNPNEKKWVADPELIKEEFTKCAKYYEKYIVEEIDESEDEIIRTELINRWDGFYTRDIHASGKVTYTFVG